MILRGLPRSTLRFPTLSSPGRHSPTDWKYEYSSGDLTARAFASLEPDVRWVIFVLLCVVVAVHTRDAPLRTSHARTGTRARRALPC